MLAGVTLAIPESGGATPDFLAETRWQIEWLLAMEYADGSGRFSNAVKSPQFPSLLVMPENDTSPIAGEFGQLFASLRRIRQRFFDE